MSAVRNLSAVTAVIKTFLRDDACLACVDSLRQSYPEMPIIVADDGYVSDRKERALADAGISNYIRMPFNVGLSRGRNALVNSVGTDYALVGDDDFQYSKFSGIEKLLALMDVADVACGSAVRDDVVHRYEYLIERRASQLRFVKMKDEYEAHEGIRYASTGLGLNFFVGRTHLLRAVRWDENIRIRWEHEDFFLRVRAADARVVFCPDAKVLHRHRHTDTPEYLDFRNDDRASRLAFMARWGTLFRTPWESNFEGNA